MSNFNRRPRKYAQKTDNERYAREDAPPPSKPVSPKPRKRQGLALSRPKQVTEDMFKPKNLSTKSSELKNDPHLKDAIIVDGYSGLVRTVPLKFSNDYSQYTTLVRTLYTQISKGSKPFKLNVSMAMFEYYSNILLWQRLFSVLSEREIDSSISDDFTKRIGRLLVPMEINRYLEGIGNVKDPDGRQAYLALDAQLRIDRHNGLAGHYGQVNALSHVSYETQPSPFIAAYRVLYEYCYSVAAQDVPHGDDDEEGHAELWPADWDLPHALAPADNLVPNRNLLGWMPIQTRQTREMMAIIERYVDANIEEGTFEAVGVRNVHGIPIMSDILDHVSQMLSVVKRGLEENNGKLIEGSGGSCSQVLFQHRVSEDVGERGATGNQIVPVAERIQLTYSYTDVGLPLSCAASLFKYRVSRRAGDSADCYCYTARCGGIPPGWPETEDRVFNSQPRWNFSDLSGTRVSGTTAAIDLIFKTRKVDRIGE